MDALMFDTTFLIDFQRERGKGGGGPAHDLLREHRDSRAVLPVVALGEYREGFADVFDPAFLTVVESFEVVPVSARVAEIYGREARRLRAKGRLIGANDLWIAATALERGMPLVTRNLEEFARVEGLQLCGYL